MTVAHEKREQLKASLDLTNVLLSFLGTLEQPEEETTSLDTRNLPGLLCSFHL